MRLREVNSSLSISVSSSSVSITALGARLISSGGVAAVVIVVLQLCLVWLFVSSVHRRLYFLTIVIALKFFGGSGEKKQGHERSEKKVRKVQRQRQRAKKSCVFDCVAYWIVLLSVPLAQHHQQNIFRSTLCYYRIV